MGIHLYGDILFWSSFFLEWIFHPLFFSIIISFDLFPLPICQISQSPLRLFGCLISYWSLPVEQWCHLLLPSHSCPTETWLLYTRTVAVDYQLLSLFFFCSHLHCLPPPPAFVDISGSNRTKEKFSFAMPSPVPLYWYSFPAITTYPLSSDGLPSAPSLAPTCLLIFLNTGGWSGRKLGGVCERTCTVCSQISQNCIQFHSETQNKPRTLTENTNQKWEFSSRVEHILQSCLIVDQNKQKI